MSLLESITLLKGVVGNCEKEIQSLEGGKKASAARARKSLQNVKASSHALRKQIMQHTKALPVKKRGSAAASSAASAPAPPPPATPEPQAPEFVAPAPKKRAPRKKKAYMYHPRPTLCSKIKTWFMGRDGRWRAREMGAGGRTEAGGARAAAGGCSHLLGEREQHEQNKNNMNAKHTPQASSSSSSSDTWSTE